jgi:hypothetical protein
MLKASEGYSINHISRKGGKGKDTNPVVVGWVNANSKLIHSAIRKGEPVFFDKEDAKVLNESGLKNPLPTVCKLINDRFPKSVDYSPDTTVRAVSESGKVLSAGIAHTVNGETKSVHGLTVKSERAKRKDTAAE